MIAVLVILSLLMLVIAGVLFTIAQSNVDPANPAGPSDQTDADVPTDSQTRLDDSTYEDDGVAPDVAMDDAPRRAEPAAGGRPAAPDYAAGEVEVSTDANDQSQRSEPYVPNYRKAQIYEAAAGRSPIPQPGETLYKPLPFTRITDPEQRTAKPGELINWAQAPHYIGQHIIAEGRVVTTNNVGSVCFVNFSQDWRQGFYVVVFEDCYDQFPSPPETLLLNKTIRVSGKVTTHKGRPQIRVESADQVTIVADKSS